jgi:hypothetical protein
VRQLLYPVEFRITLPRISEAAVTEEAEAGVQHSEQANSGTQPPTDEWERVVADVATCLWYLKTKYFKRDWSDLDPESDDAKERRALGRLERGIEALVQAGIEVHDPTNDRFPIGGEGMMKALQTVPTPGLSHATVTETVRPIVYRGDRQIQRAEVFLAVPDAAAAPSAGEADSDDF